MKIDNARPQSMSLTYMDFDYIIQTTCLVELMLGMMIDDGPKFYSALLQPMSLTYRSRSQTK